MEQPSKLLVTILNQGYIRPELAEVQSLMLADKRVETKIVHLNMRPSENARNSSVKKMLDEGYDYLLTIDHDTVPLRNPIDLIELGLGVVGFAVPQWNISDPAYPIYFVGMDRVENGYNEHKKKEGLQEVDAVGSGCLLMSRKVLEAVKEPFVRKWEDGIAVTGLDFYFCEKVKEQGFKVYCHYDYVANHFKEISLLDVLRFKNS